MERLLVAFLTVFTPHHVVGDEAFPVVVVALTFGVFLLFELLDFVEFVGANTVFGHFLHALLHEQEHRVDLGGGEGAVDLENVAVFGAIGE